MDTSPATRTPQRIFIVGDRGREQAIAWRIERERPGCRLFAATSGAGMSRYATIAPVDPKDTDAVVAWCRRERPDLVIVGPGRPLRDGIVDTVQAMGLRVFGPVAAAARIEWSKAYGAEIAAAAGVPMPPTHAFDSADAADASCERPRRPSWSSRMTRPPPGA